MSKMQETQTKGKGAKRSTIAEKVKIKKMVHRKTSCDHRLVHARAWGVPMEQWSLDDFLSVFVPNFTRQSLKHTFATPAYDGGVLVSGNVAETDIGKVKKIKVKAVWDQERRCLRLETDGNPTTIAFVLRHIACVFPNLYYVLRLEPKYPTIKRFE